MSDTPQHNGLANGTPEPRREDEDEREQKQAPAPKSKDNKANGRANKEKQ